MKKTEGGKNMKKRLFLLLILIMALSLVSCDESPGISGDQSADVQPDTADNTLLSTPEPIEEAVPASTPDADPYAKLILNQDENYQLIHFWTISEMNVDEQGVLTNLSASFNGSFINLNYFFNTDEPIESIKALYSEHLEGEWEKDEYAAGPILDSETSGGDSAYIQIVSIGSQNELSAFLSTDNEVQMAEFSQLFYAKWPIAVVPLSEDISDDGVGNISINIYPQEPRTVYSVGYNYAGEPSEIMEFYKQTLAEYENFTVSRSYDNSEIITCTKSGIDISLSYDSFFELLVVEYTIYE